MVKSYGADYVYDYRSATAVADIKKQTGNALKFVLDCISSGPTMEFCYQAIGRTGGKYTRLEPYPEAMAQARANVSADWVLAPLLSGKPIAWPAPFQRDADAEAKEFAFKYFATIQDLLDAKRLRPHRLRVMEGFGNILEGLDELSKNKVSGEKLVVKIA